MHDELRSAADLLVPGTGVGGGPRAVLFDLEPSSEKQRTARRIARQMVGHEFALVETYGLSPEALSHTLNHWRTLALQCADESATANTL